METITLKQYVVDAFTDTVFGGNPAAVCVMDEWLPDETMQKIARENCLSETAFTVKEESGYRLRWFTPGCEVKLCGHATLATAYVLADFYEPESTCFDFDSLSGPISVKRDGELFQLNFPAGSPAPVSITPELEEAVGFRPAEAYLAASYLLVMEKEENVAEYKPDAVFICINGRLGNMNAEQALEVARRLGAPLNIPNHYDMFESNSADPRTFVKHIAGGRILSFGEELVL